MKPALLLLNGELRSPLLVRRLAARTALTVCADGGLRHAVALKLRPRIVIGDMDSLPKPLPRWKDSVYLCDFDENRSDFEKALAFLHENGAGPVWVAGALGGRLDHLLVNLRLIESYSKKLPIVIVDGGQAQVAGLGRHVFACKKGQVFSLLPASRACRLTTRGLRYPLRRGLLARASRGLSNRATAARVDITVHEGRVWILR